MSNVRRAALLMLFLVGLYPRPKHLWRNVFLGALVALVLGVASLWMPIWAGTMESWGHNPQKYPIHVTFWKSDFYLWLKAHDFNLLLLVP